MGPAGSGKGTQGEMLHKRLGLPLISVGQTLRDLSPGHPWYNEINETISNGNLAPHDKVAEILKEKTTAPGFEKGYIMDGWGRTTVDLEYFDPGYDKVFFINIPREISLIRLSTRRTCETCGAVYNVVSNPSKVEGVCDKCGGALRQRDDDKEEAILKRLEIFTNETSEQIQKFRSEGVLVEIDGSGTPEEVFEEVKKHL
ncbi:MAG: Adenylate kinase [candidate division WWE3 bacterium GW2011_GWE2_43_18]|nr:adenylate kinase, adenylate kinase [uncultured bacterium Rifle_16ft_4_minimus_8052]KKS30139.1 MAG: Adenylate kinase [candidate division WWE3 bacterium GW2011_GWB1_42_117]KKT05739.1 MAG: Adenylate kinase [candidate division WWE3 bacterium GW2011_GWE2_43_18]KKT07371.1 MAG: Adenylate kinase [candidate division WWE3 bacterium GW2011_GWF2_43_18]KKT10918.1 MAG: Adenylate kinase [candidate division WWE3 bacterium GW2011_GWA2_43_24]KKT27713.1 MAG: Adenylate kinase [candidate division WWE3 bacterium